MTAPEFDQQRETVLDERINAQLRGDAGVLTPQDGSAVLAGHSFAGEDHAALAMRYPAPPAKRMDATTTGVYAITALILETAG